MSSTSRSQIDTATGAVLDPEYMVLSMKVYPLTEDRMEKLTWTNTLSIVGFSIMGAAIGVLIDLKILDITEDMLSESAQAKVDAGIIAAIIIAIVFGLLGVLAQITRARTLHNLKQHARTREITY